MVYFLGVHCKKKSMNYTVVGRILSKKYGSNILGFVNLTLWNLTYRITKLCFGSISICWGKYYTFKGAHTLIFLFTIFTQKLLVNFITFKNK